MMWKPELVQRLGDFEEFTDKLILNLENCANETKDWLASLSGSMHKSEEEKSKIQFPNTPLATRRTRKKPMVETITEEAESTHFAARDFSHIVTEISFANISMDSSISTRSSRAASKTAHLKISAQSKQTLNQKLRRPTRSKPGVTFMPPPPQANNRRAKKRKSSRSCEDISIASSFASARESVTEDGCLNDSIQVIEAPESIRASKRLKSTSQKEQQVVVHDEASVSVFAQEITVNVTPNPKEMEPVIMELEQAAQNNNSLYSALSPDLFKDEDVSSNQKSFEDKSDTIRPNVVSSADTVTNTTPSQQVPTYLVKDISQPSTAYKVSPVKPVPAPRTMSPCVTAPQLTSQELTSYKSDSVKKMVMAYEMLGTVNEEASPVPVPVATEAPPMRLTRTKTRAMAQQKAQKEQPLETSTLQKLARLSLNRAKACLANKQQKKEENDKNSSGKENSILGSVGKHHVLTNSGKLRTTPLTNSKPVRLNVLTSANRIQNTSAKNLENKTASIILSSYEAFITKPVKPAAEDIEERKREEHRKREEKEAEALRKRNELLKTRREAQRRKNEEKQLKVLQSREALERKEWEKKQRLDREKEEKARQAAEREEAQREELARRKQLALQKAQEIEERRKQEEEARLARIREQEEDQRRAEMQRKKEEAEAEKQCLKRLAQEKEAATAAAKQQVATAKKKVAEPAPLNGTFTLPPQKQHRPPLRVESDLNYYLPDLSEGGSSSDDENQPRSKVPPWASHAFLKPHHLMQMDIPLGAWNAMFSSRAHTPDLALIFNNDKLRTLKRTSSAVWRTPPRFSRMPKH